MNIDRKTNILSGLKYHNYAMLITHVDAERFCIANMQKKGSFDVNGGKDEHEKTVFEEPSYMFTQRCKDYCGNLKTVLDKFKAVSGVRQKIDFGAFMYNPSCFVAFGNNDNVSFVAVDEFDAAARLCTLEDLPVRQTCFAFCPELSSLGLKNSSYQNIFCELTDIYKWEDEKRKKTNSKYPEMLELLFPKQGKFEEIDVGDSVDPSPFFKDRPLMGVTYFKLSGMAVLGPGLIMQEYIYKVMADRIKGTLEELKEKEDEFTDIIPGGKEDINSFRCMFLDPQGWSDVATLMFCQNYSVMATVIASLRFMTFNELYKRSEKDVKEQKSASEVTLREAVGCFGVHKAFAKKIGNKAAEKSLLGKNHVFSSAYSTLSIYDKAFDGNGTPKSGEPYYYNGVVIADTNVNVCAGHVLDARDEAIRREGTIAQYKTTSKIIRNKYLWYAIGHNDFVYQQLADERSDTTVAVDLAYLVHQIKSIWKEPKKEDGSAHSLARDIIDLCTDLRVPAVELSKFMSRVDKEEHIEMRQVLETLRKDLFETKGGRFDMKTLSDKMNIIRMPSPLSTAIVYLYTDFANYLTDTFLFESVLDLYDIFTAFYRLLVKELPESLNKKLTTHLCLVIGKDKAEKFNSILFETDEQKHITHKDKNLDEVYKQWQTELKEKPEIRADLDSICLNFLSNNDLDDLVELIELIQNALSNRVQISFSGAERWNVTVDARGIGLDRITSAADVPLKCGLGMLRRIMNKKTVEKKERDSGKKLTQKEKDNINLENQTCIGGASKITYNPRAFSKRLVIGQTPNMFLDSVDLNIAHLTRPRAFYIHLHETAHLISYLLRDQEGCQHIKDNYPCAIKDKCCHKKPEYEENEFNDIYLERYQEIFAEMLIHKFVFESGYDLFLRNYLANYSLDPIALTGNDDQTTKQMTEIFIRGFLASEPYRRSDIYTKPCDLTNEIIDKVCKDFWDCVEKTGPFLFEYNRLWCGPMKGRIKDYVEKQFKRIYKDAYHPVCCIFEDVNRIFKIVTENEYPSDNDKSGIGTCTELDEQINEGVEHGVPLVRVQYRGNDGDKHAPEDKRLYALYLISRLLKKYISNLYPNIDTDEFRVYLGRGTNGNPDAFAFEGGKKKKWNNRLLDRNFNGIVAADPWTRRKSMRNRIAVIKTLWDVSTNLRARRFKDMLS